MDEIQPEAAFHDQWREFYTQQTQRADKTPDMIRDIMSDREKQYWDDWSAIDHWDQKLADLIKPGVRMATVNAMLTNLVRTRQAVDAPAPNRARSTRKANRRTKTPSPRASSRPRSR
jgi:hypothetical protein